MYDIKRYIRIADMRYHDKLSLQAIGDKENLTRERVRQILAEGRKLDPALETAKREMKKRRKEAEDGTRAKQMAYLRYREGLSHKAIGKRYGLTRQRVFQILKELAHEDAERARAKSSPHVIPN